jgi:GH15 family glucan-1,4-alpha-glucosidase
VARDGSVDLAEEFDPGAGRMVGNFPQAVAHFAVMTTAHRLSGSPAPRAHGDVRRAARA